MNSAPNRAVLWTGLAAALLSATLFVAGAFESTERKIYDRWVGASPQRSGNSNLVVVRSSSTDAAELAGIIDSLSESKAIVIDQPATGSAESIATLVGAAERHGGVVFTASISKEHQGQLRAGRLPQDPISSDPALKPASVATAFALRPPDQDGVVRRFAPSLGEAWDVGVALATASQDEPIDLPKRAPAPRGDTNLGTSPTLLIPYAKYPFHPIRAEDIASDKPSFGGKTILLSVRSTSGKIKTPIGDLEGSEISLSIANGLLDGRGTTRAPAWMVVAGLLLVGAALTAGRTRPHPLIEVLVPITAAAAIFVFSGVSLKNGTWIDSVPLAFSMTIQAIAVPAVRYLMRPQVINKETFHFLAGLLETIRLGAFADSGRLWLTQNGTVAATVGDADDHLSTAASEHGVTEINRDEGQLVTGSFSTGSLELKFVLVRPRSKVLTQGRLDLLRRITENFVANLEAGLGRESREALLDSLSSTARLMDVRDHFRPDHPARLVRVTKAIAERLSMNARDLANLELAAKLHDIGKVGVPESVLDSTDKLDDSEYELVKRHSLLGRQIIESAGLSVGLAETVAAHHERWDGKGYPLALRGTQIPKTARVLTVADALISMISDRPYRRGMSLEVAVSEVASQRGRMFDPDVVEPVIELALESPNLFVAERVPA